MVKGLAGLALALWVAAAVAAVDPEFVNDSYEAGANTHRARPFKRSAVSAVVIEDNAGKSVPGQNTPDDCRRFVVTPAQVKQYFARARPVSQIAYSHDFEWSPCVASGRLELADGRTALWGVQQYGLGWLYIRHQRHYFHCGTCSLVNLAVPAPAK